MTIRRVAGSATGAADGSTWADAYTTIQAALTACNADGDIVVVKYDDLSSTDKESSVSITYTFPAYSISLLSVTAVSTAAFTLTKMGTGTYVGSNIGTNCDFIFAGSAGKNVYVYGMSFYCGGNRAFSSLTDDASWCFEDCTFLNGDSAMSIAGSDTKTFAHFLNCDYAWMRSGTSGGWKTNGRVIVEGGGILSSTTQAIGTIIGNSITTRTNDAGIIFEGVDLSYASSTAVLVGEQQQAPRTVRFSRCKLPSSYSMLASQTYTQLIGAEVYLFDCSSDGTDGVFGYANPFGSIVRDATTYFTSGAAGYSWSITTVTGVTPQTPFRGPWIDMHHTGTSAITPYIEILRTSASNDGSDTTYQDDEVWAEFTVKENAGDVLPSFNSDRATMQNIMDGTGGAAQANGAGLGSWTGELTYSYSNKCDSGGSVTPASTGAIRGRICVGIAITGGKLKVDPQIRT